MQVGQIIQFDEAHRSGVYQRVQEKLPQVRDVYAHPELYRGRKIEHHLSVALRELALEQVRAEKYPHYPSRMGCLYASGSYEEAERWGEFFARIGRPTYSIVKMQVEGNCFQGDAANCFDGTCDEQENLRLAELYWKNQRMAGDEPPIVELLIGGPIVVTEVVKEINANLPE